MLQNVDEADLQRLSGDSSMASLSPLPSIVFSQPRGYDPEGTLSRTISPTRSRDLGSGTAELSGPQDVLTPSQAAILMTAPLVATLPPRAFEQLRHTYLRAVETLTREAQQAMVRALAALERAGYAECLLAACDEETRRLLARIARHFPAIEGGGGPSADELLQEIAEDEMAALQARPDGLPPPEDMSAPRGAATLVPPLFVCRTDHSITLRPVFADPGAKSAESSCAFVVVVTRKASEAKPRLSSRRGRGNGLTASSLLKAYSDEQPGWACIDGREGSRWSGEGARWSVEEQATGTGSGERGHASE